MEEIAIYKTYNFNYKVRYLNIWCCCCLFLLEPCLVDKGWFPRFSGIHVFHVDRALVCYRWAATCRKKYSIWWNVLCNVQRKMCFLAGAASLDRSLLYTLCLQPCSFCNRDACIREITREERDCRGKRRIDEQKRNNTKEN